MLVIQCSDCYPPCTFPYKKNWTKPVLCPFWNGKNRIQANFKNVEISEDQLLEIFK